MRSKNVARVALILSLMFLVQGCGPEQIPSSSQSQTQNTSQSNEAVADESGSEAQPADSAEIASTEEVANWKLGMPIPLGYTVINDVLVDERAFTDNEDGTISWNPDFAPPPGLVVRGGFLYPADSPGETQVDSTPAQSPNPSSDTKPTTKPSPSQTSRPSTTVGTGPAPANPSPSATYPSKYCPDTREEDPTGYDSCREGFVAPTIQWAGYHSCKKLNDGNVKIFGKIKLVGGNYKGFSWGMATDKGFGLVSSINDSAPYFVSWYAQIRFHSMDPERSGIIESVYGNGNELIDDSLLAPECRF